MGCTLKVVAALKISKIKKNLLGLKLVIIARYDKNLLKPFNLHPVSYKAMLVVFALG